MRFKQEIQCYDVNQTGHDVNKTRMHCYGVNQAGNTMLWCKSIIKLHVTM